MLAAPNIEIQALGLVRVGLATVVALDAKQNCHEESQGAAFMSVAVKLPILFAKKFW